MYNYYVFQSCKVCMTFHWLPYIIPAENGVGGAAIIAVATRDSHIRVLALEVPVHRDK